MHLHLSANSRTVTFDPPQTVGDRIRLIRESTELSQTEFGKRLHLSRDQIHDLECGQREARVSELAAIAYQYQCSVLFLIYGQQQQRRRS